MKKAMVFALVLVCCVSVFAQAQAESGSKTITMWVSGAGAQVDAMKAAVEAFEAQSGYTVEFSAPGETYEELMKTKMAANDLPDVFDTHGWSVDRYGEYLMPVNDLDFFANVSRQIIPTISNDKGEALVLPFDMDLTGIVYNEDVLAKAGVDVDSIKTWADFEAACEKVKAIGKTPITLGASNGFTVGWLYDRIAPSFYITDEANSKAADLKNGIFDEAIWASISAMIDRWVSNGYFNADVVTGDFVGDITAMAMNQAAFDFIQNVAIMMAGGINADAHLGMMPIPSNSASDEPTLISGENVALGIWKETKAKKGAIELLNYLAQPEVAATIAAATGNVPALTNVKLDLGAVQKYIDKHAAVEAYNYFDRDYCPSGLWDVICAAGQEVLAQKPNAVQNTAKQVKDSFDALYGN